MLSFNELFSGSEKYHGKLVAINFNKVNEEGKFTKNSITVPGPPDYEAHLKGINKIGVIPFISGEECKWGGVDIDIYANFNHAELLKKLRKKKIPGVVTRSTNGGAHIWFFFKKPVSSVELKKYLQGVRKALGYKATGEVFPKQDRQKKAGSYMYLPYYPKSIDKVNKKWIDGCDTFGFDDLGKQLSIDAFPEYANRFLCEGLKCINVEPYNGSKTSTAESNSTTEAIGSVSEELEEAPPCVQFAHAGGKKGTGLKEGDGRDAFMFAYAMFLMKKNGRVSIKDLEILNDKFAKDNNLKNDDLVRIQRQVSTQENKIYDCNHVKPFFCNEHVCRFQKFGIGMPGTETVNYFGNFLYVKNLDRIAKLSPQPTLLKVNEAKNNMKVEKGIIKLGPEIQMEAGDMFMNKIARKQSVDNAEWHPGKEQRFSKKGVGGDIQIYNSYQPTTLEAVEGSIAPWEDYIDKRFENEECNKWFQDFLAHKIQRPEVRIMSNILLISDWGGTGKSLIDETMQELLGTHNTASISLDDMDSNWGDIIMNKTWISVEEIHDTGSARNKIAAIIKRLTTIKRMFGNMKYGKFQQAEIYAALFFMSNSKTAISVKETDRRPFIYQLDNDKENLISENNAEGDLLVDWLQNDQGYEKLLHNYSNRDLTDFQPTAWPPQTKAKAMMVSRTFMFKYEEVMKAWDNNSWPFTRQSRVYAPQHIAKIMGCDETEIENLFKKQFKCELLKRVQNIDWVIFDRNDNNKPFQIDASRQDITLWSDDEELLAQKKVLSPKDCMGYYLHPCMNGQRKLFAQDDRVPLNLYDHLDNAYGDGMKDWDQYLKDNPREKRKDGKHKKKGRKKKTTAL